MPISVGIFRLQTFYSNLPNKVGTSIQVVFQNIENESIHKHVKIDLKNANFHQIS